MLYTFTEACKDVISFFRNPEDVAVAELSKSKQIKLFTSVVVLDLAMTSGVIFIINLVIRMGLLDNMDGHQMNQLLQSSLPLFMLIFTVIITVVVTPFIEELIFRLFLRFRYNPGRIIILAISSNEQQLEARQVTLKNVLDRHYGLFFYFSVALFAGVHLFNFELEKSILLWSPILLMPQLILGFFTGYLRVKYGLVWGYYLHVIHNFVFIGSSLLMRFLVEAPN